MTKKFTYGYIIGIVIGIILLLTNNNTIAAQDQNNTTNITGKRKTSTVGQTPFRRNEKKNRTSA